jgi:hypothetical protein
MIGITQFPRALSILICLCGNAAYQAFAGNVWQTPGRGPEGADSLNPQEMFMTIDNLQFVFQITLSQLNV